jgi:predicted Fe-S protein YdhL (DUF1289 family)
MISPCVRLCRIDAASGLCTGCGRSLNEIGGWLAYTDDERRAIMALLGDRLARIAPTRIVEQQANGRA